MFAIATVAAIVYAVLTAAVGARILILAGRTRALPEVTLGVSYIFAGMLGWAASLVGLGYANRTPTFALALQYVGLFCMGVGHLSTALFSWRVFTPKSGWAGALFAVLVVTGIVEYVHNAILWGIPFPLPSTRWYWPGAVWRTSAYVWMALVALRYHRRLRRRLALGLADPIATNRVLLWGLIGVLTVANSVGVITATLLGLWTTSIAPTLATATMVNLAVVSVLGILAFYPPIRYLTWVAGRAPRTP